MGPKKKGCKSQKSGSSQKKAGGGKGPPTSDAVCVVKTTEEKLVSQDPTQREKEEKQKGEDAENPSSPEIEQTPLPKCCFDKKLSYHSFFKNSSISLISGCFTCNKVCYK